MIPPARPGTQVARDRTVTDPSPHPTTVRPTATHRRHHAHQATALPDHGAPAVMRPPHPLGRGARRRMRPRRLAPSPAASTNSAPGATLNPPPQNPVVVSNMRFDPRTGGGIPRPPQRRIASPPNAQD